MTARHLLILSLTALAATACGSRGSVTQNTAPGNIITQAQGLSIERAQGYTTVAIADPWNAGKLLRTYILVPRGQEPPADIPDGVIVRTPIQNAVVYSSVHGAAIKELGAIESLKGVCDAQYFNMPEAQAGIEAGTVADCGNSMSPTVEKIVALSPDAIILSPFQNTGYGAIESLGTPIIECADYMENTPLGRAEWIKLFGELYCRQQLADSIFEAAKESYNTLKASVADVPARPKVLTEMPFSGVWYVPAGESYMATMLRDAGADYPWSDTGGAGSIALDLAQTLDKAGDADIWLIKPMSPLTYATLKSENALYAEFEAYKRRQVYQCVSTSNTLYQDFPFHPDALLRDYVAIFHPDRLPQEYSTKYYEPLTDE